MGGGQPLRVLNTAIAEAEAAGDGVAAAKLYAMRNDPAAIGRVLAELTGAGEPQTFADDADDEGAGVACVLALLDGDGAEAVLDLGDMVNPIDLAEDGAEDEPHVTALYGLAPQTLPGVIDAAKAFGPIPYTLGKCNVFPDDGQKGYDVVYVEVVSPDLVKLNAMLRELPHENAHPDYTPHATVAYVRPGMGEVYARRFGFVGISGLFASVVWSDEMKVKTAVPLAGAVAFADWRPGQSAEGESGWVSGGGQWRREKPASADESHDGANGAHAFPSDEQLSTGAQTHLKPGGEVRAVEVNGFPFIVKQSDRTAESGKVEALAAELTRAAGVAMPAAQMTTVGGRPALVQQFVKGKTVESLNAKSPDAAREALGKVPKAEIDKNVLLDYLLGNTDVHNGNYMITEDSHLVPIDKEFILGRGNLTGQKFEMPRFLSLIAPNGAGALHAFDPAAVKGMADAGEKMAAALEGKGLAKEARQVRDRAVVLHELAKSKSPTAGSLQSLGSAGVTPPNLGFVARLKWLATKG